MGFALLLRFTQVEAALKILRYWEKTSDGWPDRLQFVHANWKPLRDLKALNPPWYSSLIGAAGNSLQENRNRIAHEGSQLDIQVYQGHIDTAEWALGELQRRIPSRNDLKSKVIAVKNQIRK
jgi:hypothetical protein